MNQCPTGFGLKMKSLVLLQLTLLYLRDNRKEKFSHSPEGEDATVPSEDSQTAGRILPELLNQWSSTSERPDSPDHHICSRGCWRQSDDDDDDDGDDERTEYYEKGLFQRQD
ncbi:hypothetical protein EYF80_023817 [Liparis tanakae]|uniref:Uncharacterized protein n=1 Tax=Liparis tanakae TaxID=230148 RepID=A0A4Z2HLX8_9TELE|nr:hypothetical protein EYF80_023817 [Liparis tanakae]